MATPRTSSVVQVPDLTGMPMDKAQKVLANIGLSIETVLFRESYEDKNTVVEQEPKRGQMTGDGTAVTVWVARRGYIEHLPAIFRRSDGTGKNVVRDMCFLFEHMFGGVEETLDQSFQFFDPHECPEDFLGWLASWTAMIVDADWSEARKRTLIKRAVDLYRLRGTKKGLTLFLRLFTGLEPIVKEREWPLVGFRIGTEGARIGVNTVVMTPPPRAFCFTIEMPVSFSSIPPEQVVLIHQVIRREKPAHTHYYLAFASADSGAPLREFFTIGIDSGIGVGAEKDSDTDEQEEAAPALKEESS